MTRLAHILVVATVLATAAPSGAGPLEDAQRHYQRLRYDEALATLAEHRKSPGADPKALAQGWLLEGFISVALGREADALGAFDRALRLDPMVTRSLPDLSPKIRVLLDQAEARTRDRGARRRNLAVEVTVPEPPVVASRSVAITAVATAPFPGLTLALVLSSRSGVRATLPMTAMRERGDRFSAPIPAELMRPDDELGVFVEAADAGETFARFPGKGHELVIRVPAHRATITVSSPSRGAELLVNGVSVGRVPLSGPIAVEPGVVRLALRGTTGTVSETIRVRPGETPSLALVLGRGGPAPAVIARYTLIAVGAALIVVGAVLGSEADQAARDLEGAIRREPGGLPTTEFANVSSFESNGRAFQTASIVSLSVGGAATLTGLALFAKKR